MGWIQVPSSEVGHTLWEFNIAAQLLKMAIEIVDLPSYKMVIFNSYVSLPEGISG